MTIYKVTKIQFDFSSDDGEVSEEYKQKITSRALTSWVIDDEEDLVDEISDALGWCISSIEYHQEEYSLVCFADDDSGDNVTEGVFNIINDAWEHNDSMGSRWFFFPLRVVVDNHTNEIVSACDELNFAVGISKAELFDWLRVSSES